MLKGLLWAHWTAHSTVHNPHWLVHLQHYMLCNICINEQQIFLLMIYFSVRLVNLENKAINLCLGNKHELLKNAQGHYQPRTFNQENRFSLIILNALQEDESIKVKAFETNNRMLNHPIHQNHSEENVFLLMLLLVILRYNLKVSFLQVQPSMLWNNLKPTQRITES